MTMTTDALKKFCLDTENPYKNFELAEWYYSQGNPAAAFTYYARAAERFSTDIIEEKLLAYRSIIYCAHCFGFEGAGDHTKKNLLETALMFFPEKAEAYYFLSLLYEKREDWQNAYMFASMGLANWRENDSFFKNDCDWNSSICFFPGKYALLYQKSQNAMRCGKGQEARRLLQILVDDHRHEMTSEYTNLVAESLLRFGSGPPSVAMQFYSKKDFGRLRYKFRESEKIEKNYSQVFQDMFVLSMLNGKKNGTYLEIGSGHPFWGNNTALLEKMFDWNGIGIEWSEELKNQHDASRKNLVLKIDALTADYDSILKNLADENGNVDYLQLDCEPSSTTYEIMTKIPFDKYKFSVITYEHDHYVDITRTFRNKSRKFLENLGYILVVSDVSPNDRCSFEDWWVHPDLVNQEILSLMSSVTADGAPQEAKKYMLFNHNLNVKKKIMIEPQFNPNKCSFSKHVLNNGGKINTIIIPAELTNGTGTFNPSIYNDNGQLMSAIRHCQVTIYHSEKKIFEHEWGPLVYVHPENDWTLTTTNYFVLFNDDLSINKIHKIDMSAFDVPPVWNFVGLEDCRLFRWNGKLYICGVRRDTTPNGEGRMELSEIELTDDSVKEVSRYRIPILEGTQSYCEKNWMPIVDMPYHFVKWCTETEVVKVDVENKKTLQTALTNNLHLGFQRDLRGSSHVLPWKNGYFCITHEVDLYKSPAGRKDGKYYHRFVFWDSNWNIIKKSEEFSFLGAEIEFCAGMTKKDDNYLISFGLQDNCAFVLTCPEKIIEEIYER